MPLLTMRRLSRHGIAAIVAIGVILSVTADATAQTRRRRPRASSRSQPAQRGADVLTINYPDSVNLSAFVDFVSQSMDIKIIYGSELKSQSIVFRPGEVEIPKDQVLNLLRSMLRMHNLALVQGDVDGWLRIIPGNDMQRHMRQIRDGDVGAIDAASSRVVSQVVRIKSNDFQGILKHVRSFLSSSKASIIEVPAKGMFIITDYESAIAKAVEIIKLIDVAPVAALVVNVSVRHHDAASIVERVMQVLNEKARLEGVDGLQIAMQPDLTGGGILLIGPEEDIAEAEAFIRRFDVPHDDLRPTVAYVPKHISADRLQFLIENVVAGDFAKTDALRVFLDSETNRLYVTCPPQLHTKIDALLKAEDVEPTEASRPFRIYRPRNRLARELLSILSEVLPVVSVSTVREGTRSVGELPPRVPPGPNRPPGPSRPGQVPPMPPAQEPIEEIATSADQIKRVEGSDFVLTYDEHTNALIAVGSREFHVKLEALILELDRRKPQVMIEVTLVAVTFNDSLSMAIEVANEEMISDYQTLFFSSFGLSDVDIATGRRTFRPGGGFNGIILGPHETPFLIRAIAARGNSRVIATPRILLSDNTSATLNSVEEEPFTSINASDTVATTSFAGFESAGTTMTVTPHITEGDHLSLDYSFSFSNFTGSGSVGVPPPRTTNSFSGTVDIPDLHTIVVGGLVIENESDSVTEIPLLGRIPIIGAFFQTSDRARTKSRIFAFIRPTILRDDKFADLKLITETEMEEAQLSNRDFPESEPQWMR